MSRYLYIIFPSPIYHLSLYRFFLSRSLQFFLFSILIFFAYPLATACVPLGARMPLAGIVVVYNIV